MFHLITKDFLKNSRLKRFFFVVILILGFSADYARGEITFEAAVEGLEGEVLKNVQQALSPPEGMIQKDQIDEFLLILYEKVGPPKGPGGPPTFWLLSGAGDDFQQQIPGTIAPSG